MSKQPFVSVVVPAHNEEGRLGMTLDLLKRQTYPRDKFEIIVVDNNSTDRTAEVARAAGARVITEPHPGVAWAREAGWKVATGEIVLSTDADVQPPENWMEQVVHKFSTHPELVGLTGGLRFFDK
ncbi:MAG: glycosyltransferase family A protein, partial [Patescibacteria group bacterium]